MATYYFRNTGDTNWGTASNWSLTDGGGATGAVPTAADDALFTANSGNCTVNASNRVCKTLNFTGYTNTITMTFGITVSGNVTLSATMGIAGTANLTVNETSTLTSNGKTWSAGLILGNVIGKTYTLADNWIVSGNVQLYGFAGGNYILNGNSLSVSGNLIHNGTTLSGTTTIILLTGCILTQTGGGGIFNNLTINGNVTISGTIRYSSGTLTYTSGTVTVTGSTLVIQSAGVTALNTSGMSWNNVTISGGAITLTSNLNIGGLLTTGSNFTVNNTFNINCSGGISLFGAISQGTGTTTLNLLGGTWSTTAATGTITLNTFINGNITISGTVYYNTRTLTYTSGTVTTTGSTLNIAASTTLNTSGMSWNNVTFVGTATITLSSNLNINGIFAVTTNAITVNGTFDINANGGFSNSYSLSQGTGTTTLNIKGGSWVNVAVTTAFLAINTRIDGNVTIASPWYQTGTLTYVSGTVTATGTPQFSSCTLNTNGITWNNLNLGGNITLLSDLNINGLLSNVSLNNFTGNFNINCAGGLSFSHEMRQVAGTTTTLILTGGTWSSGGISGVVRINMVLNGNITISGTVRYSSGTLTYTSGTITTTGSTLNISLAAATIAINNSGLVFNDLTTSFNLTFSGTNGCTINGTYSCSTAGTTHIFVSTLTYTINALNIAGTNASRVLFRSSTGGSKALINLSSIQSEYYLNVTDINGSGGAAGYTFGGIVTNSDNWNTSAILYYVGTANFSSTTSWSPYSGGVAIGSISAPASTDDIAFDANSVNNCTMNVAGVCKSVNFTGYVGTITMTFGITVSGSVTLVAAMTIAGASGLTINATGTFTSNGKTWPNALTFSATNTLTLADDLNVSGLLTISVGTTTVNGTFNINASGGITINANLIQGTGTTTLNLLGGTWSSNGVNFLAINTNINGNITISGTVQFRTGTLTYTSGTVTLTGSTLLIANPASLNVNGIIWDNVTITQATITLLSDLNINGLLNFSSVANVTINGSFNINAYGGVTVNNIDVLQGTGNAVLNLLGGTWNAISVGSIKMNTVINGNITISGSVRFNTGTLTYISGTVTTTGSTILIGAGGGTATLNTNGITWNNVTVNGANTIVLTSDLNINGVLLSNNATTTFNGTFNINVSGGLTLPVAIQQGTGVTTLNLLGGTWSTTSVNGILRLNTVINGNITISGNVYYNTGTLTYTSGTVTTTGSTLNVSANTTFNVSGITWNNVTFSATNTTTLTSDLNVNGLLTINGVTTINGTFIINANGGLSVNTTFTKSLGTPKVNLTGGSWNGGGGVVINLDINGNVTIGNATMSAGVLTYVSGNVTHTGTLTIFGSGSSTTTLNTNGINWNNVSAVSGTFTILLQSDLNIYGLYTTNGGANNTTISGTFNINCYGGIVNNYGLLLGTGSPTLNLYGGTWSMGSGLVSTGIQINTNIIGNITILGTVIYTSRTLRYISGKVNCLVGSILALGTSTLIDCDKVNFRTVSISSGATLTMNKFFSGSALIPTTVRAAATYTITFQDGFEKITKFTKISNCTMSRRGQLLCITDKSNKGGNVGIRYINQSPNSIPKNAPSIANMLTPGLMSIADPSFIVP